MIVYIIIGEERCDLDPEDFLEGYITVDLDSDTDAFCECDADLTDEGDIEDDSSAIICLRCERRYPVGGNVLT